MCRKLQNLNPNNYEVDQGLDALIRSHFHAQPHTNCVHCDSEQQSTSLSSTPTQSPMPVANARGREAQHSSLGQTQHDISADIAGICERHILHTPETGNEDQSFHQRPSSSTVSILASSFSSSSLSSSVSSSSTTAPSAPSVAAPCQMVHGISPESIDV